MHVHALVHTCALQNSSFHLSYIEVQQLHDEAVGAPVGDLRRALHQVVVWRAQPLEHVTLPPERALILRAALEELESDGGAVKHGDSAVHHAATTSPDLAKSFNKFSYVRT